MEAHEKELMFLSLEGKVIIPFFQRTYVWSKENWETLLDGLSNKEEGSFLGSIILKQLTSSSGEHKKLEVVDGQQRLTTLSILIKALYDMFSEKIRNNSIVNVRNILFTQVSATSGEYFVKIEHSQVDKESYEKVINANMDGSSQLELESINENSHKILKCYKYFCEALKEKSEGERDAL